MAHNPVEKDTWFWHAKKRNLVLLRTAFSVSVFVVYKIFFCIINHIEVSIELRCSSLQIQICEIENFILLSIVTRTTRFISIQIEQCKFSFGYQKIYLFWWNWKFSSQSNWNKLGFSTKILVYLKCFDAFFLR